ncbi:hypothetical protein [Azospirillum sp. ST 5-10]|uniref:hypothetical protein n=1 Tax=unclassified Azospirillum TaxID=2630922 RepID=UPI003F4A2F00
MAQRPEASGRDPASDHRPEATGGGGPYTDVDSTGRLGRTSIILGAVLLVGLLVLLLAV